MVNGILAVLLLAASGYVPEPQPVRGDVEITAIYYPGTDQMSEWDMVVQTCPERKPLLGWYDEGNPEAIHYGIERYSPSLSPEAMKPGDTRDRFSYDAVIPTGWGERPRPFAQSRVIAGRTPEKFAEICRQAKSFCDRHGKRHAIVMPINEWQEGSYVELNEEYGFGMYDAIRDAFCEKPAAGWPKNLRPADVGLGPYDFPPLYRSPSQRWGFADSVEGWYRQPYGGGEREETHFRLFELGCDGFSTDCPSVMFSGIAKFKKGQPG